ncbi:retrovirus-related pol polyprotein from transposon TNT 1-94 [Tanacetum coccineum]
MPRKSSEDYKNTRHYIPKISHEFRTPIREKLMNLEERYIHEGRVVFENFADLNYVRSLFHFVEFECLLEINEQICPRFILEFYSQYQINYSDEGQMFVEFVIQNQLFSYSLENFAQILDIPCEGACVFTDRWRLDELAYGIPSDGPYQTNPPSIEDIISSIRIDREGQVRRIRHEEEIDVLEYQILTREIVSTLKPLEEIIRENIFCLGDSLETSRSTQMIHQERFRKIVKAKVERISCFNGKERNLVMKSAPNFRNEDKEYPWRSRDYKNDKSERKCFRCGDPNHLIRECPKPPRDKNQRASVESCSDSGEEAERKDQHADMSCSSQHQIRSEVQCAQFTYRVWGRMDSVRGVYHSAPRAYSRAGSEEGRVVGECLNAALNLSILVLSLSLIGGNTNGVTSFLVCKYFAVTSMAKDNMRKLECRVTFSEHDSEITKDGKVIGRGIRKKDLYVMKLGNKPKDKICLATIDENSTLWHRRLGHANMRLIQSLASKELVRNLPKLKFDQHFCDACKIGKQAHVSHKAKNIVSTTRCLELLHMDLFGPSAVRSYEGNRYTLVIVDDYSREFDNEVQFGEFCNANGITHNFSAPRTPQSNGVVERKNRTLQEMSRTMLNEQSLPQKFWCNAVDTSTYILNRILIRAILGKTPYEILRGRKPTLDYFRVFGSKCFILNTKDYLTKFDPKSYEGVFLGYSQNSKAYIILNKHTRKIEESLNVTFNETPPPSKTSPLVDDDLDEEEAIREIKKKNLENVVEDETLEIDEIVNIKESRNHPLKNVIGNLNQRTLRSQA